MTEEHNNELKHCCGEGFERVPASSRGYRTQIDPALQPQRDTGSQPR